MTATMQDDSRYVSCMETAKLIRLALKREFPGVTFSIHSNRYSGGSSIDVRWTDGPIVSGVRAVTGNYTGGGFDGSIDLAYSCWSWLIPDGTARPAYSAGTVDSRGSIPGYDYREPVPDGAELVRFAADFVFCQRRTSLDRELIARDLCELQQIKFAGMMTRCLLGAADDRSLEEHVDQLLERTPIADGGVYSGVYHSIEDADPAAWCTIAFN